MNEPSLPNSTSHYPYQWYSKRPAADGSRVGSAPFSRTSRWETLTPVFGSNGQSYIALRLQPVRALCMLAVMLLALVGGSASAVAQSINLSVRQIAQPKKPALNSPVNYTIIVKNTGLNAATGVTVRDSLPVAGTTFGALNVLRGSGVTHTAPGDFTDVTIPSLASGDSVVLQLTLTAHEQGVWFNVAEVTAAMGTDVNSVPGNHSLLEDDYNATCFAIPLTWYPGDQFLVSIPSGYSGIQWYRNGKLLTATSDSAVVNPNGTLTIKGPGAYSFSTTRNGCTNGNCCDIEVVAGAVSRLGNFVFDDVNVNGIQDAGEPGLLNVAVTLYLNGTAVQTVNTNADGLYTFNNLTPGSSNSYVVGFTTPSGYAVTAANVATGTSGTDSDAGLSTGRSGSYTLTPGEYNQTIDAGFYAPASLGNYVFADNNRNGLQDGSDTPIASVTVTLYQNGTAIATTITDGAGLYEFTNLTPGSSKSYVVGFTTPTNFTLTTPLSGTDKALDSDVLLSGKTGSLTLASGQNNTTIDAGFAPLTAGLGNYVFGDLNANGIQDAGDKPISGVKVTLLQGGTVLATTTTNLSGLCSFTGLTVGVPYSVSFTAPVGLTATLANIGDDALDSDGDKLTGLTTQTYSLSANEFNQTIDMGYVGLASLGSYVFADNNKDGVQDAGDAPIAGVTVTLYQNGTAVATTVTDPAGKYIFTGLTPGSSNTYVIGFSTPTSYTPTSPLMGADTTKDSNLNPLTGLTTSVILSSGQSNTTVDAGFVLPSTGDGKIGDYVWYDYNGDGRQGPATGAGAEPGVPGVTVQLYNATTNFLLKTTQTGADGKYLFDFLDTGAYYVTFNVPDGSVLATYNAPGVPVDLNSDAGLAGRTGIINIDTTRPISSTLHVNLTVDAGITPFGSIGDLVFRDTNGDGIQNDGANTGIAGVKVQLFDLITSLKLDEVLTNNVGTYQFDSLKAGTYQVKFVLPAGETFTKIGQGTTATDSDASITTGLSGTIVIDVKQPVASLARNNPTIDAGISGKCLTTPNLIVSANQKICVGEKATVVASTTVPGSTIEWFLTPLGGDTLFTTRTGQSYVLDPTTSTTYYARATTPDGCQSTIKAVVVTVNVKPATPTCLDRLTNSCPKTTADLTTVEIINQPLPGSVFEFHTTGNPTSPIVTNQTAVTGGKYYLFEKSKDGCYSNPTVVTVEIVDCSCKTLAGVTVMGPAKAVCSGDTIRVSATLQGAATSVIWTADGSGTFGTPNSLNTYYIASAADKTKGSITFTATTNDPDGSAVACSPAKSAVVVTLRPRPNAPLGATADNPVICLGSKVNLVAFAPGYSLYWYDANNKYVGTASSGLKLELTPTTTGLITYYAETIGQDGFCPSETRTPVTILVQSCLADLSIEKQAVTAGPYKTGQKVVYSLTARNNGSGTANTVTVSEALPAGLSYISSTPAGEFDPATGVWTVGQLTVGASRNLQIETTLTGSGLITNKAVVRSPDNDITKTFNDTSIVKITTTTDLCSVAPPRVYCAITEICKGEFTTLTARDCDGTIVWSDGQTGGIVNVRPTVTTTYSASCVVGTCSSGKSKEIVITVLDLKAPILTASSDAICPGGSVTLTVSGCTTGKPVWSEGQQGVTSIVVVPTVKTTYTVQCQVSSCLSPSAEKTIDVGGTTLPKPTVVCSTTVVCPGESVTLEAKNCGGTPLWNTGETTPTILVFPTAGKNVFFVTCKSGSCVSPQSDNYTIKIVTPAVPTVVASADTVCVGGAVTLTASGCEGTVIWSVNSLTQTANSITITPSANQSYYAQCKFRSCLSDRSVPVAIAVGSPTPPTISVRPAKPLFCAGESVTLTAANCNGTVHWSNNAIGATLTFIAGESASYTAYCAIGSCRSANSNTIQVSVGTTGTAPTVTASSLTVCNGASVTLTAANCAGTVQWSDNQTGASITVRPTLQANEYYAVCKPTSGTACGSPKSATTKITVTTPPIPTVTCSTTVVCPGESVNLVAGNCIGTPIWSTGATTPTIDVKPAVTTGYTVYCKDAATGCTSPLSATYTITVIPVVPPTITASATAVSPGQSVTLTASACPGVVSWSNNLTGQSIVITPTATTTLYAQCKFRTCLSDPSATVKVILSDAQSVSCLAKAGTLTTDTPIISAKKGTTAVLTAKDAGGRTVPTGYTVVYVLTKGSEQVIQQLSSAASFTVSADSTTLYTIHTLVYNANKGDKDYLDLSTVQLGKTTGTDVVNAIAAAKVCADLDVTGVQVRVKYLAPPVIVASASEVCYGTVVSFTATGCNGIAKWSNGLTGNIISLTVTENTSLQATCTENGITSDLSKQINVNVIRPAAPTVASNRLSVCTGETAVLTAIGCDKGTIKWSNGATGSSITVTPTASLSAFKAQCVIGACLSDYSLPVSLTVGSPVAPTVGIAGIDGSSATICSGASVTLTALGCQPGTSIRWSNDQTGSRITVAPAASVAYTAQCYSTTSCLSAASKAVSIVVRSLVAQPHTADLINTCPFITVDLTKGTVGQPTTTGGVFEYYTDAALTTKVATSTAAAASGTYYVVEKSEAGCYSLPGTIRVLITPCGPQVTCDQNPITVNAGIDAGICAAKDYKLAGVTTGTVNSVYWTTTGTGTFNDPYSPTATYTASSKDIETGNVTLTLTAKANNPSCPVVSDALSLTITGVKTVPSVGADRPLAFCAGDSVTLRTNALAGYTYKWSTKATTPGIVVKTSGTYTVTVFDANGCSSLPSAPVTVTVRDSVATPVVSNIRNVCPETTASLNRIVAQPAAPGTTYEFRTGPVPATSGLLTGTALSASATVYVYAKSTQGCYSRAAIADVKIVDCKGDTARADVSIRKTADRTIVKPGTPVKYTIRVTNNGPAIARSIDIRDVLPTSLSVVPGTTFKLSNGIITKRFDSLAVGKSDSITFLATVTAKGPVVNRAWITYTALPDPVAKNDTASVTVQDTTTTPPVGRLAIGLAKGFVSTKMTSDSTFEATYAFAVRNYGSTALSNVKITDNLSRVFATHTIRTVTITTEAGSTLKPNPAFTGTGTATQLLDSTASTLAAGASQSVRLTVSVKLNKADTTRTFANSALVTALNSGTLLQDASVTGTDPDPDNDGNPNNNAGATTFRLTTTPASVPQLGVALAVVRAVKQPNDSYNVTYKVTVKNFGTVKLTNVSLLDSLGNVFKAPVSYSVVVPPTVAPGSGLVPVSDFNGGTVPYFLYSGGSTLAAGATDSLTFTINVKPTGNFGPFNTSVTASATPESSTVVVRDVSNNGYDPKPEGSLVTPVLFNLPSALLGVAKSVGTPVLVEAGVYDVPYTIRLTNTGTVALKKVQVVDNLNKTFNRGALIVSSVVAVTADAGLTANPGYSGQGLLTNMLTDSLSTLPVGASRSLRFSVRVNVKNADSLRFYNTAVALATTVDGSLTVRDTSTAGTNPDPDNDLDPRNNSVPTVVTLNGLPGTPRLGLALSIRDTVRQANGTYNVTYRVVVKNYGAQNLASVALTDTLAKVFSPLTGATYTMVGIPRASAGSQLTLNPLYNGNSDARLTVADSTSKLGVGKVDTVFVTVNVVSSGRTNVFLNTVYGSAKAGTVVVTDVSTNGLNPDLNSNGNPSDSNESEATPLVLNQITQTTLFIPEGFSPNNDGINDVFVIQGTQGLTVYLEVFNRWGHLVYKNADYKNDWNGVSNTGLLNGDGQGLPEGTYFYRIRLSDGREFVRYMTINR